MSSSNRTLKLKLYAENPFCYYCGRKMILTNIKEISGKPDPLMCTVEHLVSRYNPERWVKAKPGEVRKVLACFQCNNERASEETKNLHPLELKLRGQGYSLNPRGKPVAPGSVNNKEELFALLEVRGIEVMRFDEIPLYENSGEIVNPALDIS